MNTNVDAFIRFIQDMLARYEWQQNDTTEIYKGIEIIRDKEKDKNLYLGVVGEFSSGKSTLINSLLRANLLKTDADQGTTAAATVIKYGRLFDVQVKTQDGRIMSFRNDRKQIAEFCSLSPEIVGSILNKLMDWFESILMSQKHSKKEILKIYRILHILTADESVAKYVQEITIYFPSEKLEDNLVIIDTPGTDAQNQRHTEVTERTIRELCDAAVVVVPADKPLSMTLKSFLNRNLLDILHRCIFAVTKIETIVRDREQKKIVETVKGRIEAEWSIPNPIVLPMPSLLLCEEQIERTDASELFENFDEDKKKSMIEMYEHSECMIYKMLQTQKQIIQLEIILKLLNDLFQKISSKLKAMEHAYIERHRALEQNRIKELGSFTDEFKSRYNKQLSGTCSKIARDMKDEINKVCDEVLEYVKSRIQSAENKQKLNVFLKKEITGYFNEINNTVAAIISERTKEVYAASNSTLSSFESEFKKLYAKLSTLGGLITENRNAGVETFEKISNSFKEERSTAKKLAEKDESKQGLMAAGGAAAGAAIGTMILPGIGSVVGAVLGGLASMLFGPSLDELKNKYSLEIETRIQTVFADIQSEADSYMEQQSEQAVQKLYQQIDQYMNKYDALVKEMILKDEEEKRRLAEKTKTINADLDMIEKNKRTIGETREELKKVVIA